MGMSQTNMYAMNGLMSNSIEYNTCANLNSVC